MPGKISLLPNDIREQLHQRLRDGKLGDTLLPWLNSLPETQAILSAHFEGQPISEQNLSAHRQHGYRRWEICQAALEFAADEAAGLSPSDQPGASPLVDHLVHWIATRFAAAAHNSPIPEDPEADLREISRFLTDIVALRRGDLVARRLGLEQRRLALDQARSESQQEKTFWEWTKRPDIQAKLFPRRDPDKLRRDAIRLIDQHLLGVKPTDLPPEPEPDPACLV